MDISLIIIAHRQFQQPRSIVAHPITVSIITSMPCLPRFLHLSPEFSATNSYSGFSSITLLISSIQFTFRTSEVHVSVMWFIRHHATMHRWGGGRSVSLGFFHFGSMYKKRLCLLGEPPPGTNWKGKGENMVTVTNRNVPAPTANGTPASSS
jgi:hypothetical protein